MKSYKDFWEALKPAYPITKWEIKLPIATNLEEFNIDHQEVVYLLDNVIQQLFQHNKEAIQLASLGYASWFTECYSNEFTWVIRFDCMFNHNKELKLVEANTNWPDGLLMHDITYGVLSDTNNTTHLDLFLQFFDKNKYTFILYEEWWFIDPHYLEYEKLKEKWYPVGIWTFEKLEFRNNNVYYNDHQIDTIRLSMNSWRFSQEEYTLLKNSHINFINTFDLAGLADKSLLQYINHNNMIMKTNRLTSENKDIFITQKNSYVLKPTNLNEWIWVIIWVDTTQEEREQHIKENINNNYLVQEFINIQTKQSTLYQDWDIITDMFYFDYCPHLFYKKWTLIWVWHTLVRYSKNKIVNVLRWWGIGYVRH